MADVGGTDRGRSSSGDEDKKGGGVRGTVSLGGGREQKVGGTSNKGGKE